MEFSVLVTAFTSFFTFLFLFAQLYVVVPLFLRFQLDLGCYFPFGVEKELLFWCLPSFLSVWPSHFVVTHLFVSKPTDRKATCRYVFLSDKLFYTEEAF